MTPDQPLHPSGARTGLTVEAVTSGYRSGPDVVHEASFRAPAGQITALVGPNGSGKSTLLHTVLGLVPARSGRTLLDGTDLRPQVSEAVGFCADDLPLPELLTGVEYVQTMAQLRGRHVSQVEIGEHFEALRMGSATDRLLGTYSHGMKRKAQLVANLLHEPSLLILDEPFRGLDPETTALLRRVLTDTAADGRTILVSTHDLGAVASFCDRVTVLSDGVVVLDEEVGALREAAGRDERFLEDAFLEATGLRSAVEESAQRAATLLRGGTR